METSTANPFQAPAHHNHSIMVALCAPALLSIWLQFNMYSFFRYAGTSIENSDYLLLRGFLNVLLGLLFLRSMPPQKAFRWLAITGFVLLTASSVMFFSEPWLQMGHSLRIASQICAVIGLVLFAAAWADLYARMDAAVVNSSIICSCGLGALSGSIMSLLPTSAIDVAMILVPALLLVAYNKLNPIYQQKQKTDTGTTESFDAAQAFKLGLAVCLLAFGVGFGIEFRFSNAEELGNAYVIGHQVALAVICAACLGLSKTKRALTVTNIWVLDLVLAIIGLSLYMAANGGLVHIGLSFLTLARQLAVGLAVLTCFDIATKFKANPVLVFLIVYGLFILACAAGGRLGMAFDTGTDGIPLAIAISVMPFVASLLALASTTGIGPVAFWLPGPRTQKPEIAAPTVTLTPKQLETRFGLTARESEVALMLAHGRNSSYIATELGISDNTVRNYSRSIYSKMGVHTKQELIDVFDLLLSGTAV